LRRPPATLHGVVFDILGGAAASERDGARLKPRRPIQAVAQVVGFGPGRRMRPE